MLKIIEPNDNMKKTENKNPHQKLNEIFNEYNKLVEEFAISKIEKTLDDKKSENFFKRWDRIALKLNNLYQVYRLPRKKLKNPFKIDYRKLRKIYNKKN